MNHTAATAVLFFAVAANFAQTPIIAPPIDVLSVRQNLTGKGGSIALRSDGIYAEGVSLRFLVDVAFNHEFAKEHIVNMPSWAETDRFDIAGKVAEADILKLHNLNREEFVSMRTQLVQALLGERFGFKSHTEVREGAVYELVIARGGPRFQPSPSKPPREYIAPDGEHVGLGMTAINGKIAGHMQSITMLGRALQSAGQLDRVVVDRTGLAGNYDFALNWTPDSKPAPGDDSAGSDLPSLFTAIQEQLGLKLVSAKGPVNTLVIDHIAKPTDN